MTQNTSFARSFNAVKGNNYGRYNLTDWTFTVNNQLNIINNNPQKVSIVKTNCGGLFECTNCKHKWTKKFHSTILFQCDRGQRKIECKLFGHNCLKCGDKLVYHTANYEDKDISDTIEFLRKELLRKLHPEISREERRDQFPRRSGPVQQYYNVDFADYCESCKRGDYCRLHTKH